MFLVRLTALEKRLRGWYLVGIQHSQQQSNRTWAMGHAASPAALGRYLFKQRAKWHNFTLFTALRISPPSSAQTPGELDWTALMMPCANGRRRPKGQYTMVSRLAASSWDQLQILHALCLTKTSPVERTDSQADAALPYNLSVSLERKSGWRQGGGRNEGILGTLTLVRWDLLDYLDYR